MEKDSNQQTAGFRLPSVDWRALLPITNWLPAYERKFLSWDLIAGITLASFVLPESMAYATLAGMPVQSGIYCCLAAGLFYALFTTTKQVAVGPTSAISLMVGTTVATISGGDPSRWIAIAGLTALVICIICLLAFLLKLSSLVSFISESILLGFKAGAALSIASTQLPKIFGIHGGGKNFFERMAVLFQHLPETNWIVFAFGMGALLLLILGDRLFPGRPVSLAVVVLSIIVVSFTPLAAVGLHITGNIPGGLPSLERPSLRLADVDGVIALAFACFLMGYIETVSAARTFALKNNYEVNPRQELLALGAANLATAFSGAYPVAGGLSQSTVNDKSGAKTPLSLIVCSLTLAIILLFFTSALKNLPEVLLAIIVIHAISGLIKIKELKQIYQLNKTEFLIAMIAIAGVLVFGILKGVMIAAVMSIAFLIRRTATPHVAILGRIKDTDRYSDIARHPDNTTIDSILIFRIESSILYFNADYIREQMMNVVEREKQKTKLVILDLSSSPYVDVEGSRLLLQLCHNLEKKEILFRIVEARSGVRDLLRKQGMEEITGPIRRITTIQNLVDEFSNPKNPA